MSNPITKGPFGTLLNFRSLRGRTLLFVMCLVLLLTSLDLHYHVCSIVSMFLNYNASHIFFICTKTFIGGEMLAAPTQCHTIMTYGNADVGQKSRFSKFHSA